MGGEEMVERIVARTQEHGGATFSLVASAFAELESYWYFPKYPSRTRIVDPSRLRSELLEFIQQNHEVCRESDVWIGTWLNPRSGRCYLDITMRMRDQDEAIARARLVSVAEARNVVTIYNPYLDRTEYVWDDVRF
ncbi:hypothetical protein ACQPXM_16470 [Kribbella sp. CA-253562]|uniref:hypothetical protein n=1 Tax=Kribbella sp. CA-253562 TaxID=3239942 RepID=UPI003D8C88FE